MLLLTLRPPIGRQLHRSTLSHPVTLTVSQSTPGFQQRNGGREHADPLASHAAARRMMQEASPDGTSPATAPLPPPPSADPPPSANPPESPQAPMAPPPAPPKPPSLLAHIRGGEPGASLPPLISLVQQNLPLKYAEPRATLVHLHLARTRRNVPTVWRPLPFGASQGSALVMQGKWTPGRSPPL